MKKLGIITLFIALAAAQSTTTRRLTHEEVTKDSEILEKNFKVALLVGIGDYDQSLTGIPELKYPVADIRAVASTLKVQGYTPIMLTDRQATAARVRQQLKYLADEVEAGKGTAIFYFSGHGFRINGENYLATYNTTLDDLAQQGLAVSEVQTLLAATGAKQRVVFIDACRNDPEAKSISGGRAFDQLQESEGLRILYSTGPGKVSYEDDALQQGVFSYYVAKGLHGDAAGPDGMVTFDDLKNWVSDNMRRYSAEHQRPQIPYQLGESSGDFLLAKKPTGDVAALADPTPTAAPVAPAAAPPTRPTVRGAAAPVAPPVPANDPPARVARLSLADGPVTLQPAGVEEWTAAEINRPVTTGDSLWVADLGHAELEIANGVVRLSDKTGFTLLNLDDHTTQIKLTQGSLSVRLNRIVPGEVVEVDTPNTAVSFKKAGTYDLRVSATGDSTVVAVNSGTAEGTVAARSFTLGPNQTATVSGLQSPTLNLSGQASNVSGTAAGAEHDRYFEARDRRPESVSSSYVGDGMVGTSDLDEYGTWLSVRGYGMAWIPRVPAGWEPYRFGHWSWVAPWGWSWVDDQPWGFAPFHYGRWIQVDVGWAWLPGGSGLPAAYSPALVAWSGPPGTGAPGQASNSPVSWFPLGPGETYVPAYSASPKYMSLVNASNVNVSYVNPTSVDPSQASYMYRSNVTAVSHDTFVSGAPVSQRTMLPVSQADLNRSRVSSFAGAAPQKESLVGSARQRVGPPPAGVMNRMVVARTAPPPPPVPFSMQERALATGQGRPIPAAELRRVQPAARADVLPAAGRMPPGREAAGAGPAAQAKPVSALEQQRLDRAAAAAAAVEKQKEARAAAIAAQQAAVLKRQQQQAAAKEAQQKALELKQAAKAAAAPAAKPVVPAKAVPPKLPVVKPVPAAQQ